MLSLSAVSLPLMAAPPPVSPEAILDGLQAAESGWVESLLGLGEPVTEVNLDEQIFTELSPILDSPEAVRLPPDQVQAQ